uniref:Uncharacterized protein n=1 Tax=Suricata suricatta TaxID=37032 RepID=A0A673TKN7_SURSU
MSTSSPGIKDPDPPPAVVRHHDPPGLATQRQPRGVDQGAPASEGVHTYRRSTSGLLPVTQTVGGKARAGTQCSIPGTLQFPIRSAGAWDWPGVKRGLSAQGLKI